MSDSYTYTGNGAFLPGIPARDLTEADVRRLAPDAIARIDRSGIYRKQKPKPAEPKPESTQPTSSKKKEVSNGHQSE